MNLKVESKKNLKREALINAALKLFGEKGIKNVSILEITNAANVAKGTFYLYFKDKLELEETAIVKIASQTVENAVKHVDKKREKNPVKSLLWVIDEIINKLKNDKELLNIIHKNLSWSLYERILNDTEKYEHEGKIMIKFIKRFCSSFSYLNYSEDEMKSLLFLILELVNCAVYSSIMFNEPMPLEKMTDMLHMTIKKLLD